MGARAAQVLLLRQGGRRSRPRRPHWLWPLLPSLLRPGASLLPHRPPVSRLIKVAPKSSRSRRESARLYIGVRLSASISLASGCRAGFWQGLHLERVSIINFYL